MSSISFIAGRVPPRRIQHERTTTLVTRVVKLLALVSRRTGATIHEIADELGVSKRQAYRYVAAVSEAGVVPLEVGELEETKVYKVRGHERGAYKVPAHWSHRLGTSYRVHAYRVKGQRVGPHTQKNTSIKRSWRLYDPDNQEGDDA